jgi:hypothetical protein
MPSEKKIATNRINGRKSRGPQTAQGKSAASRNALRHGITTINYRNPAFAQEIEEMALALCEGSTDPCLFQHALTIAECDLVLGFIRRERVAAIERCRDRNAFALAKRPKSVTIGRGFHHRMDLAFAELGRMGIKMDERGAIIPEEIAADPERREYQPLHLLDRDELEAFCEAMPDLTKLERYERRAWSRQKRAIDDFLEAASWEEGNP